jgi:hypothetical protein
MSSRHRLATDQTGHPDLGTASVRNVVQSTDPLTTRSALGPGPVFSLFGDSSHALFRTAEMAPQPGFAARPGLL